MHSLFIVGVALVLVSYYFHSKGMKAKGTMGHLYWERVEFWGVIGLLLVFFWVVVFAGFGVAEQWGRND